MKKLFFNYKNNKAKTCIKKTNLNVKNNFFIKYNII